MTLAGGPYDTNGGWVSYQKVFKNSRLARCMTRMTVPGRKHIGVL